MKGRLYGASVFLQVQEYTNVQRWTDAIAKRPAARRRRKVNRTWGEPSDQLHDATTPAISKQRRMTRLGIAGLRAAGDSSRKDCHGTISNLIFRLDACG